MRDRSCNWYEKLLMNFVSFFVFLFYQSDVYEDWTNCFHFKKICMIDFYCRIVSFDICLATFLNHPYGKCWISHKEMYSCRQMIPLIIVLKLWCRLFASCSRTSWYFIISYLFITGHTTVWYVWTQKLNKMLLKPPN
jgi:hypothetical protein